MAQMTEALAHAILAGDGITRNEVEQLCHFFLRHSADLARLTAELDNAKIAIDGLQNTLRKEREQHHKAQDELEHKQRECEGLRLWAEALEKDWLTREQWALIGGGMRLEQALIHANARMKQARAATIKAALSSGEKNDGHA